MLFSTLAGLSALSLAPAAFVSARHGSNARRHHDLAHRSETSVHKRDFSSARFTYYDITVGQVACEGWYKATDYVVAMNVEQYGSYWKSNYCGSQVSITYNGKTTTATVVDECMGCPYGGLDFTQGLFEFFADTGLGVLYGEWSFIDGSSSGSDDSTTTSTKKTSAAATSTSVEVKVSATVKAAPTTTSTKYTPTTTYEPETTSKAPETTWKAPETTSKAPETTSKAPETTSEAAATTSVAVPTTSVPVVSSTTVWSSAEAAVTSAASSKTCAAKRKRALAPAHMPARAPGTVA